MTDPASTKLTKDSLLRAIEDYVAAYDAHSWRGAGDPFDVPYIEADLKEARAKLNDVIDSLFQEGV